MSELRDKQRELEKIVNTLQVLSQQWSSGQTINGDAVYKQYAKLTDWLVWHHGGHCDRAELWAFLNRFVKEKKHGKSEK